MNRLPWHAHGTGRHPSGQCQRGKSIQPQNQGSVQTPIRDHMSIRVLGMEPNAENKMERHIRLMMERLARIDADFMDNKHECVQSVMAHDGPYDYD